MERQSTSGNNNIQVGRDLVQLIIHGPDPDGADRAEQLARTFYSGLVVALICTMLPHPTINLVACVSVVLLWLTWSRISGKKIKHTLVTLTMLSIGTGCVGPGFHEPSDFAKEICTPDQQCLTYFASGFGVLGFGLEDMTRQAVVKKSGFSTVRVCEEVRGYGLISVARVNLWGE